MTAVPDEETLLQIVDTGGTPDEAVETLIDAVDRKSGSDDTMCVVVFFDHIKTQRELRPWRCHWKDQKLLRANF